MVGGAFVRRWYGRPVIAEVVFELWATPDDSCGWHDTSHANMVDRLPGFSGRLEWLAEDAAASRYRARAGSASDGLLEATGDGTDRLCRWNDDGNRAIQLAENMCSYNVFPPYGHFEDHLPSLDKVITAYLNEAEHAAVDVLGQHYLNVFRLGPEESARELFTFFPPMPKPIVGHVPIRLELEMEHFHNGVTLVRLSLDARDDDVASYILEVEARSRRPMPPDPEAILQWHHIAHESVNRVFELSITPKARERMKEL